MAEIPQNLYTEYVHARQLAKDADALVKALAEQIRARVGEDEQVTVNGTKVGTFERIKKFAVSKFTKDHPELAVQFMVWKTEEKVDEKKLARMLPDLYRQYQVRQLVIGDE